MLALFAKSEYFQDMTAYFEFVLGLNGLFQLLNQTLIEVHAGAAFFANQVMMVLTRLHHLVAPLSVTEARSL